MKFWDIEQRTEAWHTLRLGMPTASQFDRIIGERQTKTGVTRSLKPEGAKTYEAQLIAERIFKIPFGPDLSNNRAVQYGVEREAEARRRLEDDLGCDILDGGFFTDDAGRIGCSPDGRIESGNVRALVELKAPQVPQQIKTILWGIDDYYAQIQGQLLITGYDCCHFLSWRHDAPLYYAKIEPDLAYQRDLARLLDEFCERLEFNHRRVAELKGWPE